VVWVGGVDSWNPLMKGIVTYSWWFQRIWKNYSQIRFDHFPGVKQKKILENHLENTSPTKKFHLKGWTNCRSKIDVLKKKMPSRWWLIAMAIASSLNWVMGPLPNGQNLWLINRCDKRYLKWSSKYGHPWFVHWQNMDVPSFLTAESPQILRFWYWLKYYP